MTMATFVHLAPRSRAGLIRRNGLARTAGSRGRPRGVFAVPVTRNFYVSHQWLRELARRGQGPIVGIYFRVHDTEPVWIGHYNRGHTPMSAAEAVARFSSAEDPQGWEVIVPRRVDAREIQRVRALPQVVGWRYHPGAKGTRPCPCSYCTRGDFGARRLRERLSQPDA